MFEFLIGCILLPIKIAVGLFKLFAKGTLYTLAGCIGLKFIKDWIVKDDKKKETEETN